MLLGGWAPVSKTCASEWFKENKVIIWGNWDDFKCWVCACRGKRRERWVGAGSVSCHLSLETYSPAPPASAAPVCGTALVCSQLRHGRAAAHCFSLIWVPQCSALEIFYHAFYWAVWVRSQRDHRLKLWFQNSALRLKLNLVISFEWLNAASLPHWESELFIWCVWLLCFILPPLCSSEDPHQHAPLSLPPHTPSFANKTVCISRASSFYIFKFGF